MNPIYIADEGQFLAVVAPEHAPAFVKICQGGAVATVCGVAAQGEGRSCFLDLE